MMTNYHNIAFNAPIEMSQKLMSWAITYKIPLNELMRRIITFQLGDKMNNKFDDLMKMKHSNKKTPKDKKTIVSFNIECEYAALLELTAAKYGISKSELIRNIIEFSLK